MEINTSIKAVAAAAAFAVCSAGTTGAAVIVDPSTGIDGSSGSVLWNTAVGTGFFTAVNSIAGVAGNEFSITVESDSTIDFSVTDIGTRGDAFALQLDGVTIAPTSGNTGANTRGPGATAFFSGTWDDIFLSAGAHTLSLFVTDACCTGGGTVDWSLSAATPVNVVPLPAGGILMLTGLAGFAVMKRRRKTD